MTDPVRHTARAAAIAAAALLVGCGDDPAEAPAANAFDANLMLEAPANDASAMESAAGAPEPAPEPADANAADTNGPSVGETEGGDTGGNTMDSNVAGM